jgi:PAS domain S-box-containing protein
VTGDEAGTGRLPILGAVLAVGDASTLLFDLLRQPVATSSRESLLVREDGTDVLFLSPLRFRPDPPLSFRLPLASAGLAARASLSEKDDFRVFSDYRGARVFAAVRRLESAPWGLVVKVDEDEALAAFRKDMLQKGATWGVLLVALFAAAVGFWRSLAISDEVKLARSEARNIDDRMRTQLARSQLAAIVESSEEAIVAKDMNGNIVSWNASAERIFGYRADEMVGTPIVRIIPLDRRQEEGRILDQVRRGEHVEHFETVRMRRDAAPIDVSVAVSPVKNAGGQVVGASSVMRDITVRLRAEETLRKLSHAVEQSPASIVITGLLGNIEYVNPKFTRVTGYSSEEVVGKNPRILKSGEAPPDFYRDLWSTITAGREWQGEFHNRKKNGELFWELASISPVFDKKQKITHFIASKEDITERKRAAEELAKREVYFRSLIEHSLDIVAVIASDGELRYASPSAERILGYPAADLPGLNAFDLIHPDDRSLAEGKFRRSLETGTKFEQLEVRVRHRDGSWRTLSFIGRPLPPETGMRGLIINARDQTDRQQLEAQLRQSQKMEAVGRLAGGVAHDFNNLLTVIFGYSDVLLQGLEPGPLHEAMQEVRRAGERAAALTRQLLAFSRKQTLVPEVLDMGDVVSGMSTMVERLIGEDIKVSIVVSPGLGRVKADRGQLEQILMNLAVNARDAMPKGGSLTFELQNVEFDDAYTATHAEVEPGPYVLLAISDTGTGMDAETQKRIFEPFFTTKEAGKGTGLGLSTVYGIVRQSGGSIEVYSEPGRGTTFKVYLPRLAGDEAAPRPASGLRRALPTGSETVLVVEDEAAIRQLTNLILKKAGYTVLLAESPVAAERIAGSHPGPIHLLLTDVVMPGMRGPELAERLLRLRPDLRVLYMSGYTDDAIAHHGFLDAGTEFLQKPFTPLRLMQKIREVLDALPA